MLSTSRPSAGWLCALLAGVAAIGIVSAPTSMAYLQDSTGRDGVALTSGTTGLVITPGTGGTPKVAPTPGYTLINSVTPDTLSNTGDAPLLLSVVPTATTTVAGSVGAWLQFHISTTTGDCRQQSDALWVGGVASNTVTPATVVLQPGATTNFCIGYLLHNNTPPEVQQSPPTSFTVTVTGTQVPR